MSAVSVLLALIPAAVPAAELLPAALPAAASVHVHQPAQPTPAALSRSARPAAFSLLRLDRHQVKWGDPRPGTGAVIRYAFVANAVERREGVNCTSIGPIGDSLPNSGLTAAHFAAEIRRAMADWEAAADVRFVPADDKAPADLLIGVQRQPQGIAYADVILKERGAGNTAAIGQAAICFNPELAWEDGFDGDDATPDVRYVAGHELGHVLGLDHAWGPDKLMNFKYRERLRTPQKADLEGAAYLYGARKPPSAPQELARLRPGPTILRVDASPAP